jgi:hypothetical protein
MGKVRFREELSLHDGSLITVEVEGDEDWWANAQ